MNVEKFISDCYELMHDLVEQHGKSVEMVLMNSKNTDESLAYAYSKEEDSLIEIRPHTKENEAVWSIPEWDFNFDNYLFEQLESNYEIGMITPEMHYNIWNSLNELFPEELNNLEGVQKYLQYCKDNNITKQYIEEQMNMKVPDVMQYLGMEPLEMNDIIEYKGYVAQVDERNSDEPRESIVYIYESKQDMIDGNYIDQISLRNENIKNYIKEYIDESFISEKEEEKEAHYITFVLGYDLLRDMTHNSSSPECDINYEFCMKLTEQFMESSYYKDNKHSMYDMLEKWIHDNKVSIQANYNNFIGIDDKKTRTLDNGIYVMNLGFRKDQPIALIEKSIGEQKQYIVAFNYIIKDNKMEWAYAYYYENNKDKAINDFKKVTSGGDIADTFKEKNSER